MKIKTPDHFMGEPIPDDAIEIALAEAEREKERRENIEVEAHSLEEFIYVPSVKLYFAKERTLLNHNWYDTHKKLDEQNLKMPTIPQFIEFLRYLRADLTGENKQIYDKITEVRNPWRREWLDAKFSRKDGGLGVTYNHIVDSKGNVVPQENEKLEGHLMQDKEGISLGYWLNNPTKQGLPQKNSGLGDLWYVHPKAGNVTSFFSDPDGPGLDCYADPSYSAPEQGVFACAEKLGGKQ